MTEDNFRWNKIGGNDLYYKFTCKDFTLILNNGRPNTRDKLFLKNHSVYNTLIKVGPFEDNIQKVKLLKHIMDIFF